MRGERLTRNRKAQGSVAALVLVCLLAAAPAFACGGNRGQLTPANGDPARADAGATIDLTGSSFQSGADNLPVTLRWGGPSGVLLAQVVPDADGRFTTKVTVPSGAQTGFHQIAATQRQAGTDSYYSAVLAIEVQGAAPAPEPDHSSEPGPSPAPAQSSPAPVSVVPQPTPVAQAPAAAARRPVAVKATPAPAPAAPAAATPPAPAAVAGPAPVTPAADPAPVAPTGPGPAEVEPIPALPQRESVAMGGPRTVTIDSGAPLWMVLPLVAVAVLLFAAGCAAVVSEVRHRRVKAKVSS